MADDPLDDARFADVRNRVEHQVAGQVEAEYLLLAYYRVLAENDALQAQMHVLRERAVDMAAHMRVLQKLAASTLTPSVEAKDIPIPTDTPSPE